MMIKVQWDCIKHKPKNNNTQKPFSHQKNLLTAKGPLSIITFLAYYKFYLVPKLQNSQHFILKTIIVCKKMNWIFTVCENHMEWILGNFLKDEVNGFKFNIKVRWKVWVSFGADFFWTKFIIIHSAAISIDFKCLVWAMTDHFQGYLL